MFSTTPIYSLHDSIAVNGYEIFTVEKVVSSDKNQVNRYITYGKEDTGSYFGGENSHYDKDAKFLPGETTFVQIGGVGCPVVGKLTVSQDSGIEPNWNYCVVECEAAGLPSKIRVCPVAADGTFRLDDILPGNWTLKAKLYKPINRSAYEVERKPIADAEFRFTVGDIPGGVTDEPLDVGTIPLERTRAGADDALRVQ